MKEQLNDDVVARLFSRSQKEAQAHAYPDHVSYDDLYISSSVAGNLSLRKIFDS